MGQAALARSLDIGLGVVPVILCEELAKDVMKATLSAAGLTVCDDWEEVKRGGRNRKNDDHNVSPRPCGRRRKRRKRVLDELQPKAVISVERGGWNEKREHHSGMGFNISAITAKLDYLFLEAQERHILTVAFGDLGNELGMGFVKEEIKKGIPNAEKCLCSCGGGIACDVSCDIGIMCNISNWGAYGVCACLAALCGEIEVLHTPEEETIHDPGMRPGRRGRSGIRHAPGLCRRENRRRSNAMIIRLLQRILEHMVVGSIFTKSYRDTWENNIK